MLIKTDMADMEGADEEVLTMVDMTWESEQEQDSPSPSEHDDNTPRLVLISSNISWCYSLAGALKTDENVLHVIYDFDKWTFDDIFAECHRLLDNCEAGTLARSVLLICKGGPGYLYLLKNFVMTPQKLTNFKYTPMVEFWKQLLKMTCDVNSRESSVHIFGETLDQSTQGQMMKTALTEVFLPSQVSVDAVNDTSICGHSLMELYFDNRKFTMWKSLTEMTFALPST